MNQVSEIADDESVGLRFYLEYDYLTAEELSRLLLASHTLYDALFWEPVPAMIGETHDSRRSLHVHEVRTGNSVYIDLVNVLGQAVGGLDPTLAGIGGGVAVTALTARVLIHGLSSGHRALSAARRRNIEIAEQRLQLEKQRVSVEIEAAQDRLELRSSAAEAELREFVHSVLRATTAADFVRNIERDEPLTDTVGGALLDAWSVIQDDNIRQVAINGERVKGGQ